MQSRRFLPEPSRTSLLIATTLLAYALTRVISAGIYSVNVSLAGIALTININLNTAIAILAAGIAATGMDWLLRGHPSLRKGEHTFENWLLPMLTALIVGVALYAVPYGIFWWLGFGLGGILLVIVFLAEYVVVDPGDERYPLASAALTALSFTLYLILSVALRASGARLFLLVPALFLAAGLAALRALHLRLGARWEFSWATGIALVGVQLGAALHYWPISPVQYGLALLGPVYALTSLAANLSEGNPFRRAVIEPAIMLAALWILALVFR